MKYLITLFLFIAFAADTEAKDLAAIEYKIDNPDSSFTRETGRDYAKLIAISANVTKGLNIYNPFQLEKDISGMGIYPERNLTLENLSALCATRYIDYAISGKLYKVSKGFKSESILYSADTKSIISRSSSTAATINELAGKDALKLFSFIKNKPSVKEKQTKTIALLLDSSYNMNEEFPETKEAIKDFALGIFSDYPGSTVFVLPYNNKTPLRSIDAPASSLISIEALLSKIKLNGGNDDTSFTNALSFAVESMRWNKTSDNSIFIISNSSFKDSLNASRYARRAANKKIAINCLILGKTSGNDSINYSRLSDMSRGFSADVSYRQTLYDIKGKDFYLYYERARLFEGASDEKYWQNGLFKYPQKKRFGYAKGPGFADEIFVKKGSSINPYNMSEYYRRNGERGFINAKNVESNIRKAILGFKQLSTETHTKSKLARVLVSQGGISLWIDVYDTDSLDFFTKKKNLGYSLPLGVIIQQKKDEPYGFTFNPYKYVTVFSGEFIPESVKISLPDIAKNPKKYMDGSFMSPSLWFVEVKVEEVRTIESSDDVRGG
ncbi:MAG TPA: vWA domain-containing protein [Spirochaetota bacterium]|nr:vWA domain-containing protein [Spirochaetota bacterium]HQE58180.1 vWA domain-containing protein [Spirochaetota bacterium]